MPKSFLYCLFDRIFGFHVLRSMTLVSKTLVSVALVSVALVSVAMMTLNSPVQASSEVNIYSYRQPYLVEPLLEEFTKKTGVKANIIFAKKGLIERMAAEGRNSPADVLLTTDIGRLTGAKSKGITAAVKDALLEKMVPKAYRGHEGHWFGLTRRGRIVFASKTRVAENSINYEDLADPKWRGRICVRSGHHVYNVALIASMIAHNGAVETAKWLEGFKANLARKPSGNDRAQIKGVFSGECDIAIGNTYYMAKMMLNEKKPEQKEWAASVKLLFPNADNRGTHVNISGMALAKHAPNKENAVKLMQFLAGDKAQKIYASVNHEYPIRDDVKLSALVGAWGPLKADRLALDDIARLRKSASELVDKTRFNDGPSS